MFDNYAFSINPDVRPSYTPLHPLFMTILISFSFFFQADYKIIFFIPGYDDISGTFLDRRLLEDPRRPSDELLRWHFRQAVLANVRGAGEPVLEHDFPPGSDVMGELASGPKAAERMEFELFDRLARHAELP